MESASFHQLATAAPNHRLLGALAEAAAGGELSLLPDQLAHLTELHATFQAHMLKLEQILVQIIDLFGRAGIDFRVLKGSALAHLVYADPSWRASADLDLLIPSESFDQAVALAIDERGGTQAIPELRPGFDREFGKESLVRIGRLELDLHRTFVAGPFGLMIGLDELFQDSTELSIADHTALALGSTHQFLHACYNTALGDLPVRLGSVRDLLLCMEHLPIDLDDVIASAERWHGTAVLRRAASLVIAEAGAGVADRFTRLAELPVGRRDSFLLHSYLSPARSYSRPLASLAVIRGVRPRIRYATAVLAPSSEYLRSRGWSARDHVTRAVRQLRSND